MSWSVTTGAHKAPEFLAAVATLTLPAEHATEGFQAAFDAGKHALTLYFAAVSHGADPESTYEGSLNGHSYMGEYQGIHSANVYVGLSLAHKLITAVSEKTPAEPVTTAAEG